MAGEVNLICSLGKDNMPVTGGSQVAYVLVEAKPTEMMASVRMPLNFALVLDHSGSMAGEKLRNVKEAVKMVVDQMAPNDYVSVVVFDDKYKVIVPSTPAYDKAGIRQMIDGIRDGGGTAISLGMKAGIDEISKQAHPGNVNRMVLLTDGETYGDEQQCRRLAELAAAAHISIYPMGIGAEWNEALLNQIGTLSGGQEAEYIRTPGDALTIFQQQLQSAVAVVVQNAVLTLRLSAGVAPKKAVKVLPVISDLGPSVLSDRSVVVPLGQLERGVGQAVLIELLLDPKPAGTFRLAQAELSYDVPTGGSVGELLRADVVANFTTDPNQAAGVNPTVMNLAEKANAHRLVTKVLDEYKRTGKVTTKLSANVTRVLDTETQQVLDNLSSGQSVSQEQVKSVSNKTRKLTQKLDEF